MQIVLNRANRRKALTVLVLGIVFNISAEELNEIRSEEFRFAVAVPSNMVSCKEASGDHVHGVSLLLDSTSEKCNSSKLQPYIGFFGDYNVLESDSPKDAIRLLCKTGRIRSSMVRGAALAFPGHRSAVCVRNNEGGWVSVFVVAQAGTWPDDTGQRSNTAYINYTAELRTTQARFNVDLRVFKHVLSNVEVF